jgi:hypothetical protein
MRLLLLTTVLSSIAIFSHAQTPPEPLRGEDFPRNVFPPPPPFNYGLTPEQLMRMDNLTPRGRELREVELKRIWTPVWYHVPGIGRYWVLPATGQKGFIPDTTR